MGTTDITDYAKNRASLKKCRRIHNSVCTIYAVSCIFYAAAAFFMMILTVSGDVLYLFFNGPVFKTAVLVCGYLGAYKKKNTFAYAAPIIMLANLGVPLVFPNQGNYFDMFLGVVMSMNIGLIYLIMTAVLCVLTVYANDKYHILEEQPGFPHFSEIYDGQMQKKEPDYAESLRMKTERLSEEQKGNMDGI